MDKLDKLSKMRKGLDISSAGNKDIVVLVVFYIALQSASRATSWMKSICILHGFFMPNQQGNQFSQLKGQICHTLLTAKTPIRGSLEWVVWVSHRHWANNPVDEWSHLWRPGCCAWRPVFVRSGPKNGKFEATTGSSLELLKVLPGLFDATKSRSLPAVYMSSFPRKMPWQSLSGQT